jgi:hypothetical protein
VITDVRVTKGAARYSLPRHVRRWRGKKFVYRYARPRVDFGREDWTIEGFQYPDGTFVSVRVSTP